MELGKCSVEWSELVPAAEQWQLSPWAVFPWSSLTHLEGQEMLQRRCSYSFQQINLQWSKWLTVGRAPAVFCMLSPPVGMWECKPVSLSPSESCCRFVFDCVWVFYSSLYSGVAVYCCYAAVVYLNTVFCGHPLWIEMFLRWSHLGNLHRQTPKMADRYPLWPSNELHHLSNFYLCQRGKDTYQFWRLL